MPTLNPRITITLTPEVAALMKRLSQLTKNSQSAFVGELLSSSDPVFTRMITILEAAQAAESSAREDILGGMDRAQARIEKQLGLALEAMDDGVRPLLDQAEVVKRRRRAEERGGTRARGGARSAAAAVEPTPVAVTRGSGRSTTPQKQVKAVNVKGSGRGRI